MNNLFQIKAQDTKMTHRNRKLHSLITCTLNFTGYTTLYYNVSDRGWLYTLASIPAFYMYIDCLAYYFHRLTHIKWLYINIHKVHHRYHQPTAFSTVAMHPAEFLLHQSYLIIVPFYFPIHAGESIIY